jgi:excisionase family DNA binding protein
MSELYTCAQIADRYHVKTLTVWNWIRKHKLHAKKIGKQYLISNEDIKDFEKEAT